MRAAAEALPPAWIDEVLAASPRTAVFDCDGTLWRPDSGEGFMRWSFTHGLVSRSASDWLLDRYRLYLEKQVDELTICGEMVQVYAGLEERELPRAAHRYFEEEVEPEIFPEMLTLVGELRAAGTELWAVSSTCNWVVEAGVTAHFGIAPERVLSAQVRIRDGRATSELIAVPTDEGKAEALRGAGIDAPHAAFGNSMHDLAMLALAVRAWAINPSPELDAEAHRRGWPVVQPARAAVKMRSAREQF